MYISYVNIAICVWLWMTCKWKKVKLPQLQLVAAGVTQVVTWDRIQEKRKLQNEFILHILEGNVAKRATKYTAPYINMSIKINNRRQLHALNL
jgi:uncharacterized protein involved in response to NO